MVLRHDDYVVVKCPSTLWEEDLVQSERPSAIQHTCHLTSCA